MTNANIHKSNSECTLEAIVLKQNTTFLAEAQKTNRTAAGGPGLHDTSISDEALMELSRRTIKHSSVTLMSKETRAFVATSGCAAVFGSLVLTGFP